ncbi:MFS transporter [Rahnella sp. SAP-1]|uniref:MFS transporter n=1 Tax=Rouxiella aceris TaxID=2703884 RepID=A0A848MMT7_9GAMM|nr:MFS transporter [Rouxiella aceris]NMP29757.1 MFS transporter [Rouxiella aceris]
MKTLSLPAGSALPLLVAGAFFMENLDATVIVTALPAMARAFGEHPVDLNIGVSAYILTLTVFIPASGWIANRFGTRQVFSLAIILFTLASVLCSMCGNLPTFTAARMLQGFAGALMVPVGRLVVLRNTAKSDLIRAIATITWPGLVAPILGPPLGGFITTYASWHWIFILNVPLGIIALLFSLKLIPAESGEKGVPFDLLGFLLTGATCFGLIFGLDLFNKGSATLWLPLSWVVTSLLLGGLAIRHSKHSAHPLLPTVAMKIKSYAVTVIGGSLFRIAIGALPFMLPLLFQLGYGMSAFDAGLLVLAVFAGNLAMKPFTSAILFRFPFRTTLLVNGFLNALTIVACAFLTPAVPTALTLILLFISGMTRSMQFTALNTLAFSQVPGTQMSGANTLFNTAQQLSSGLGIAIGALTLRIAEHFAPANSGISLGSFRLAFILIAIIALLGMLDSLSLGASDGDEIRRKRKKSAATHSESDRTPEKSTQH